MTHLFDTSGAVVLLDEPGYERVTAILDDPAAWPRTGSIGFDLTELPIDFQYYTLRVP